MQRQAIAVALSAALLAAGAAGARASHAIEPSGASGQVSGVVRLQGSVPKLAPNPVYKHSKECGAAIADERLVLGEGGTIQNVLVHAVDVAAGGPVDVNKPLL